MMSENEKLVPKRRFKEFQNTNSWEQRKLGEMADFSKGNCYSKSDLTDEGEPVILYGRLYTKYETVISTVDTFTAKKENSVISKGNEVIIPASGETAEDISRAAVVAEQGIIIGGDLNIVRPYEEIDSIFLALTISNGKQQKELSRRAQGKSIVHLHNSDLKEVDLIFPRIDEQIRIGFFFKQLDNTIALHQRRLEKTKALKSAYLSEMFPAAGEHKPKRRFQGFADDWEQRRVKDIAPLQRGFDLPKDKMTAGSYPVVMSNGINGYHSEYKVKGPGVVTGRSGTIGNVHYIDCNYWPHNTALWVTDFKGNHPHFIYYLYQKLNLNRFGTGSGVPTLNRNDIHSEVISVPSYEEQKIIAEIFCNFDQLITLHQRNLEKLQNVKKAYLNEMFIGGEQ